MTEHFAMKNCLRLSLIMLIFAQIKSCFQSFFTLPMKKSFLLAAAAVGLGFSMQAQDKLVVTGNGGSTTSVEISKISAITFQGNVMLVATPDGQMTLPTDDINQISFELSMSGVDNINESLSENLSITNDRGVISVNAADGSAISLNIFDIKGQCCMSVRGDGAVTADTSVLPKGIYIIKVNDKIVKYTR